MLGKPTARETKWCEARQSTRGSQPKPRALRVQPSSLRACGTLLGWGMITMSTQHSILPAARHLQHFKKGHQGCRGFSLTVLGIEGTLQLRQTGFSPNDGFEAVQQVLCIVIFRLHRGRPLSRSGRGGTLTLNTHPVALSACVTAEHRVWTLKQALNCNNMESFVAGLLVVSSKFGKAPFHLHGSLFATKCDFPFGTLLPGPSLRTMGLNGRSGGARHHRGVALTFAPASRSSYEAREVRDPGGLGGPTNEMLTGLHFKLQAVEAPLLQHNVDRKRVEQASMNLPGLNLWHP